MLKFSLKKRQTIIFYFHFLIYSLLAFIIENICINPQHWHPGLHHPDPLWSLSPHYLDNVLLVVHFQGMCLKDDDLCQVFVITWMVQEILTFFWTVFVVLIKDKMFPMFKWERNNTPVHLKCLHNFPFLAVGLWSLMMYQTVWHQD